MRRVGLLRGFRVRGGRIGGLAGFLLGNRMGAFMGCVAESPSYWRYSDEVQQVMAASYVSMMSRRGEMGFRR
jgi:hypothetical protein